MENSTGLKRVKNLNHFGNFNLHSLTLFLLKLDLSSLENTVDPDQLDLIKIHIVFHSDWKKNLLTIGMLQINII